MPKLQLCENTSEFLNVSLSFWTKRVFRLLPSAWLWLAVILVACVFFNDSGVFRSLRSNIEATVAAVLQVANFRFAQGFGGAYDLGASFVYWTLSLEEQFYMFLPFLVFYSRRWLPYILAVLILMQLFQTSTVLLLMVRTDALLLGVLIALWATRSSYRLFEPTFLKNSRTLRFCLLVGTLLLLIALSSPHLNIVSFRWGLIAILCAALVLIASYNQNYLLREGRLKSIMMWVGTRSYPIYLIHIPAFYFTRELWYRLSPEGTTFDETFYLRYILTSLTVIVVFSELNYRFVETPMRTYGAKVASKLSKRRQLLYPDQ